jgi:cytosine/adenosine deaminase-related metal-dependent hydrolase
MHVSRRGFLMSGAGGIAAGALGAAASACTSTTAQRDTPTSTRGNRTLLKGGSVLTLDPKIGDFEAADVLIEGTKIAAVQPNLSATAETIDASNMIVMPGFVDTHRHMWQGSLRNILPNGLLSDYMRDILGARSLFRPEDVRIGDLVTALGAINAGVTTLLDWSHIGNSPEHTDAAIDGLRESGVRAVYGFGSGVGGPQNQFPQDIRRLRKQHFASSDQLLTLAMATGTSASDWALAREVGASISVHLATTSQLIPVAKVMGPDVTYIHCNDVDAAGFRMIADSGGHVSISCPIEMQMGLGVPPIQQALDHGIRPSLSVDVETEIPGDFFTQMRAAFTLQRMQLTARQQANEKSDRLLVTVRDVIEFATIEGARDNRLDGRIGTLTPGKEADIILLRKDAINVMPVNNVYGAVVLGMDTSNVDTVFIGGTLRKANGRLVGVDLARIGRLARASRDFIVSKAGWPRTLMGGYLPGH